MRLKHIDIGEYKNLKNFSLSFDGESFIDVFVGKNGTGKSNLFEALIEIFKHLYEKDHQVNFNYKLQYELEGQEVKIAWDWATEKWLDENSNQSRKVSKDLLPDNILIYYSGHNTQINNLVEEYESKFKKDLKEANEGDVREFIGIGKEYKAILLSVLLLQPDTCKAKQYITEKLGIKSIGNELRIELQRPFYAKKKGYEVDRLVESTSFWKAEGITRNFLDFLNKVDKSDSKGRVRDEDYISKGQDNYEDQYILFFDVNDFQKKFKKISSQMLFRGFDNLKTIEMLKDISMDVELQDGTKIDIQHFSDGQFQSIYIYSLIEMFKGKNCLTLLDEPDSFLHPEWQFDFFEQVFEITENHTVNNHVLMTSHSASTLTKCKDPYINLFEIASDRVVIEKMSKPEVIQSLSAGLISLTESEAKLNIKHFLNNTSGAVLFTEGITDEMILETAWGKLYPTEKPNFEIQNAFSAGFLRNLVKSEGLYTGYPTRKFFSLFDFDEAYGDWNQLGNDLETDPHKCLTKKYKGFESYSMLLPVPPIDNISKQVLNPHTGGNYGKNSLLTIELLFSEVPGLESNFVVDVQRTDGFKKFHGDKVRFAKEVVPGLDQTHFEVFKPIFDFIKSKV